jgi:insulin-like growth factor 2 mRNA-binding protein 1
MFPAPGQFYMSYPTTGHMVPSHSHPYGTGNLPHQQQPLPHSPLIGQLSQNAPAAVETVHLYVPNTVIGAIIGTKGLFIKSIIKNSNASVKVTKD